MARAGELFRRRRRPHGQLASPSVLLAVSLGGMIGSLGRYGVAEVVPTASDGWPWATFTVNITGCLAIGLLMVALLEAATSPHPLARPLLGVGLLGGWTTFSSFAEDTRALDGGSGLGIAVGYLLASVVFGLLAVAAGIAVARWGMRLRVRHRRPATEEGQAP